MWFDVHQKLIHTLTVSGQQTIDGFVLPTRIELSAESGQRVSVALDRYEANARFDESLFHSGPAVILRADMRFASGCRIGKIGPAIACGRIRYACASMKVGVGNFLKRLTPVASF
jgi:hypothetical protein